MTMNFHDINNKESYTTRKAHTDWQETIRRFINIEEINHAVDIGCGGGIYSKGLLEMGIPTVTGVDFSEVMLEGARSNCCGYEQMNFQLGNAYDTDLPSESYDLVLERALIHHLNDLSSCFSEAFRVLKKGGTILIQDRTPSDCLLEGTDNHIRGYFFSKFPHLAELEVKRRYTSNSVIKKLKDVGFKSISEVKLWETRNIYQSRPELLTDIRSRNGRSILHELTDSELDQLADYINNELNGSGQIVEQDQWTIWKATKKIEVSK